MFVPACAPGQSISRSANQANRAAHPAWLALALRARTGSCRIKPCPTGGAAVPPLAWVLSPLVLYAAVVGVALLRGRAPSRHALNVQLSILLMAYLLATAGLGIFWVANQQLPVFDWHYLFGYGTLVLLACHLWFNLPVVVRWWRGPARSAPARLTGSNRRRWGRGLLAAAALAGAYFAGAWSRNDSPVLPAAVTADPGLAAVLRFHEYSSDSRAGLFSRAPGIDWGNAPPAFKRYPAARQIALARGGIGKAGLSEVLRGPVSLSARLGLAELGDLLHLAAGVTERRGGRALRAAPSSGALFPSELYVLARAVDGLAAGIYHYDADLGRLDALGPLPPASGAPSAGNADVAVVLTSVFARTGHKYRNRAYRYAMADAGHLVENLRVAAHAAGLQAQLLARFDEAQLARTLGVDGVEEGVLAVMALRRQQAAPQAAISLPSGTAPASPAPVAPAGPVTSQIHQATSLQLAARSADAAIALPPAQGTKVPVRDVIERRRSQRRFSDQPVPLDALAAILADMAQPQQLSGAIRISLVVSRVQGLAPGVYRYGPGNVLMRVKSGDFAAAARSAALSQQVIGDAAAVLVLSAERGPMLAEGPRGYRHGFLEAGMLGERWLLGATARQLGACPVGAFYDDEAAALIGIDMRREWVLHFAALGIPAP
jgi:SagB-type dehydrogenase family enzyme